MKKLFGVIISIFILTGCSFNLSDMDNTPTKQVETFLNNYQTLNEKVLEELDFVVEEETTFTDKQRKEYRELMKKHYKNIDYHIKEETINGDSATVEVEIQVTDFYKALNGDDKKTQNDFVDEDINNVEAYNDYRLDLMKNAKDKVKYTLYLSVSKDDSGNWNMDEIKEDEEQKILGMYEH